MTDHPTDTPSLEHCHTCTSPVTAVYDEDGTPTYMPGHLLPDQRAWALSRGGVISSLAQAGVNAVDLEIIEERLIRLTQLTVAIGEHRTRMNRLGTVRVDERDQLPAMRKRQTDLELWARIPPPITPPPGAPNDWLRGYGRGRAEAFTVNRENIDWAADRVAAGQDPSPPHPAVLPTGEHIHVPPSTRNPAAYRAGYTAAAEQNLLT